MFLGNLASGMTRLASMYYRRGNGGQTTTRRHVLELQFLRKQSTLLQKANNLLISYVIQKVISGRKILLMMEITIL